jgi:hypothetical protein
VVDIHNNSLLRGMTSGGNSRYKDRGFRQIPTSRAKNTRVPSIRSPIFLQEKINNYPALPQGKFKHAQLAYINNLLSPTNGWSFG